MTLPKEKIKARIMMHVCLIIGAMCVILFVMSIAMKMWLLAVCAIACAGAQYLSYKQWQQRA